MTLHTTLNPLLPADNTTALVVASVNVPFLTIADAYDAHISGAADNHATTAVTDAAFAGTVAIADTATTTFTRLRQIMSGMIALSGVATSSFATAMGSLPTTLTAVNATLAAATNANTVSTLMKRDGNGDFAARDAALRNLTLSGTFTGSVPTTQLTGALAAAQMPVLTGDVTTPGASLAATVAAVGGKTASAIAQSVTDTVAATSANTFSTLVKRGAAGQVTVGALTADSVTLSGTATMTGETITGNLTVHGNLTLDTGTISGPVSVSAATGTLPAASDPALTGDVTKAAGNAATTVAFVATKSAAAVAQAVVDTIAATNLATASTLMKRDTNGDYVARDAALRNVVASGAITGAVATSNLTGTLLAAQFPALTGDVTTVAGALAATVAFVGTKSAAAVAQSVTDTIAATSANTVSTLVKRDGSGGFSAGTITATFAGNLTGTVTGSATNVNGVAAGALVRGAGVGTPATALTGSAVGQVVQWDGAQWVASSTAASDYSLTLTKLAGGAVTPHGGDLSIVVGATNDVAIDGTFTPYPGEIIDLTTYRPGSPGNTLWLLVYLNGTATARIQQGIEAAAPTKPMQQAYTKGLAYVRLAYNQTTITSADIVEARVDFQTFLGAGGSGSGVFAPLAHIHGAGGTSLVPVTGIDEGQILLPGTPGNSIIVTPMTMVDANGIVFRTLQQTVSCNTLPSAFPRWDTVALTQSGAAYIRSGVEAASPAKIAPTNVTDYVRGYIYMRPSGSRTILTDDGVNNLVYDLRPISGINQPSAQGSNANVAGGGTGQITFTQGILYSPGGVSPLLTYPATIATSGTVGILQNPSLTISPAGSTSELFNFGGTLVSGGTGGTTLRTVHIAAPTLSGGGTWTNVRSLQVDGPGFGTNPVAIFTGGTAQFGLTITPTLGPSLTQQHTIPAVAADTFSLLGAAQSVTGVKTFSAPPIFTGLSGPLIGNGGSAITALTPVNGSLLGSVAGVPTFRNAAGIRADAVTNFFPARATWDQKPPASGVAGNIEYFPIPAAMTLQQNPASGLAHIAIVGTAPATSTQTFNLTKRLANGTLGTVGAVGTVTVTTGGVVTVSVTTTTFVAGDELQISAPATQNTAMANIRLQFILDY
jgi:hypothetical protein